MVAQGAILYDLDLPVMRLAITQNTHCVSFSFSFPKPYSFQTSLASIAIPLIHCLPDEIKTGSHCLGLLIHKADLIALQALSVHAA